MNRGGTHQACYRNLTHRYAGSIQSCPEGAMSLETEKPDVEPVAVESFRGSDGVQLSAAGIEVIHT
jgi:hypothetical protein